MEREHEWQQRWKLEQQKRELKEKYEGIWEEEEEDVRGR